MIFRRIKPNANSVLIANRIIKGELYVHASWKTVRFDKIKWNEDPYKDNTWCFYLHSLDIVAYLINGYEMEHNDQYLKKAEEIIESWIISNPSKENQMSTYAWKDHSVANRVINMIQFWMSYKSSSIYNERFKKLLMKSLMQHGDYLELDSNHTFINNHGIFQDRSLIELAVLFSEFPNAVKWYGKATNRLLAHAKKDVSPSGVHLEHSDSYHLIVMRLFGTINEFLNYHNRPIHELADLVYKMQEYIAYALKPNMQIPTNGDSGADTLGYLSKEDIKNPKLLYVETRGSEGEKIALSKLYKDAGTAFIRNNLSFNRSQLYLRFLAGFHSRVHKHADDLSLLLSIGETDFFIDSGKYNYKEDDPYRQYFRSTLAHNTVTVNRKSYPIEDELVGKSQIIGFEEKEHCVFVRGRHTLYAGVTFNRTIVYVKSTGSILLQDDLLSTKERVYTQVFNIGEQVELIPLGKKRCLLESKIDGKIIELKQLNNVTEYKEYKGSANPISGWYSDKFNQKKPINQLQFTNRGENLEYKTVINTDLNVGVKYFSISKVDNDKETRIKVIYKNNEVETFIV